MKKMLTLIIVAMMLATGGFSVISGIGGAETQNKISSDTISPHVISVSPADASTASISTSIEITFSEPMNTSATESAFSLYPSVAGSFSWNTNGDTLTFIPNSNLYVNQTYRVTIDSSLACDLSRNLLDGNDDGLHNVGDTWLTKADMPTARSALTVSAVGDKIYAIGGSDSGSHRDIVEVYDTINDTWSKGASMPTARSGLASAVVNGKIYAIGGWNNTWPGGGIYNIVEEYDPANDSWTTKAPMSTARRGLMAVSLNNKIYAIGGYNSSGSLSVVEEYNPANDTWTTKAPMPTATTYGCAAVVNGKIYVTGGSGGRITQEYNPETDTWANDPYLPTDRMDLTSSAVNGKMYAIGGGDINNNAYSTNEEFDAMNNFWTTKSDMPTARWDLAATTVNGKIYVMGGGNSTTYMSKNEVYIPNDDYSWYFTAIPDTQPPAFSGIKSVENTGTGTSLLLSWSAANDSEGSVPITYNIYRAVYSGGEDFVNPIASTTNTSYMDTGLTEGTTYYYVVRAQDSAGNEDGNLVEMSGMPAYLQYFDIPVHLGWNLISYPLLASGDIELVLNDDVVWDYAQWYNSTDTGDHWKTHIISRSENDLNNIDNTMAIWLHVTDVGDGYLTVSGEAPNSTSILLHAGWNLVSYPSSSSVAMDSAGLPAEVTKIAKYDPSSPYLVSEVADWTANNFVPGNGYWLYSTADTTWSVNY